MYGQDLINWQELCIDDEEDETEEEEYYDEEEEELIEPRFLKEIEQDPNVQYAITFVQRDPFKMERFVYYYIGDNPVDSILTLPSLKYLTQPEMVEDEVYDMIEEKGIDEIDDFIEQFPILVPIKLKGNTIKLINDEKLIFSDDSHAQSFYHQLIDRIKDTYITAFETIAFRQHILKEIGEEEWYVQPITNYRFVPISPIFTAPAMTSLERRMKIHEWLRQSQQSMLGQ